MGEDVWIALIAAGVSLGTALLRKGGLLDRLCLRRLGGREEADPRAHPLPWKLDHWRRAVLPRTRFSEARRKDECCRRLLEIQLRVLGEEVRELIGGFVALPGRRRRLGADFEELLRRVLERSAREAEGAGIPALLAERFREWHLPRIRGAAETAREVLRSGVYPTPETELCALLDLLFFVFRTAVSDAAATLGSLNGELDALLERAEGPEAGGKGEPGRAG